METKTLVAAVARAAKVRFAGDRRPIAARIQVTRQCPLDCVYCKLPDEAGEPMTTGQIVGLLEQLSEVGCIRVSFSGGEPMMRPDIGDLVDACAPLGIEPEMNTSGWGLAERVDEIRGLKLLKISLDGPEPIHDLVRGREGSHREVLAAVTAARAAGIRTVLVSTITKHNVGSMSHVLETAVAHGAFAAFQPLKPYYKGAAEEFLPDGPEMRRAVRMLEAARLDGMSNTLRNSPAGLRHLSRWPHYAPLRCWAGRLFVIVGADGTLYPCDRTLIPGELPNCFDGGLAKALEALPDPECDGCGFCGALELNLAMALNWRVVPAIARLVG